MIFIGSIYPEKLLKELLSMQTHIDFAANTFQNALLSGLSHYEEVNIITSPILRMKKPMKKNFDGYEFSHYGKGRDFYVGTKTNSLYRLNEFWQVRKRLRKMLKQQPDAKVVVYAIHSPFLLALYFAGMPLKKSCLVVPDLPEFMSGNRSLTYRIAKKIDKWIIDLCIKKIDTFALLSPYMSDELPIGNKPWVQVEGLYQPSESKGVYPKEKNKTILYTGGISARYGVFDLVEAFTRIPHDDYRLWLCGGCDDMDMMNDYLKKDSRIRYFGLVDKNKVVELQSRATLLVNPRHSGEEFTKYSFPSKTMEYLASGTPTVMCKLPAMPDEYFPYVFIFEDESIDGYANKIINICSKSSDKLKVFGKEASNFILENKNELIQAKKVVNILSLSNC